MVDLVGGVARRMVVVTIDVKIDIGGVVIFKEGIPIDKDMGGVKGDIGEVTCVVRKIWTDNISTRRDIKRLTEDHTVKAKNSVITVFRESRDIRDDGVDVGIDGIVAGAIGVAVAKDHVFCAVGAKGGGAINKYGRDGVAAEVGDFGSPRVDSVHKAGHFQRVIGGDIGDSIWQLDEKILSYDCIISTSVCNGVSTDTRNIAQIVSYII